MNTYEIYEGDNLTESYWQEMRAQHEETTPNYGLLLEDEMLSLHERHAMAAGMLDTSRRFGNHREELNSADTELVDLYMGVEAPQYPYQEGGLRLFLSFSEAREVVEEYLALLDAEREELVSQYLVVINEFCAEHGKMNDEGELCCDYASRVTGSVSHGHEYFEEGNAETIVVERTVLAMDGTSSEWSWTVQGSWADWKQDFDALKAQWSD